MPITQATTNVINLNQDTLIDGVLFGKGNGTGANCIAIGNSALTNYGTSSNLIAIGSNALKLHATGGGNRNIAIGTDAQTNSSSAYNNVSIGVDTLKSNTTGYKNVVIGAQAGNIATGDSCVVVGSNAYTGVNASGDNNIVIGSDAMNGVDGFASANTIIGAASGQLITNGNNNTSLGTYSLLTSTNPTNATAIGYFSDVTGSNQVQLGNSSTTTFAYGAVQNRSDERDKTEIRDIELGLDFVKSLRPVDFKWDIREDYRDISSMPNPPLETATEEEKAAYEAAKTQWVESVKLSNITHDGSKKRNRYHHGLIAQEVKAVLDAKGIDFGGFQDHKIAGGDDVLSIGYAELIAPMIKAIQELSAEVTSLKAQLNP